MSGLTGDSTAAELNKVQLVTGDAFSPAFSISMSAVPGIGGQANVIPAEQILAMRDLYWRPVQASSALILTAVNAAGKVINFTAWGFGWDTEAFKVPGGPLYP